MSRICGHGKWERGGAGKKYMRNDVHGSSTDRILALLSGACDDLTFCTIPRAKMFGLIGGRRSQHRASLLSCGVNTRSIQQHLHTLDTNEIRLFLPSIL